MRDVQVGVLVYGINSKQSFQNLDLWLEHLEEANEEVAIFLVGNKSDLIQQRAVPYATGKLQSKKISKCVHFMETSAYADVSSIMTLFDEIGKAIVRKGRYKQNLGS